MKPRSLAVIVALIAAPDAGASILSASSQAVREPAASAPALRDATTLQHDLNASLSNAAADVPAGALVAPSHRVGSGGGLVIGTASSYDGGSSRSTYRPFSGSAATDGLFDNQDESIGRGHWDPTDYRLAGKDVTLGGFGRRDRGNPHATPEPSTWVLLASALLLMGTYAGLRRRAALAAR